jgi:RND family efflux transporter MFP subunit
MAKKPQIEMTVVPHAPKTGARAPTGVLVPARSTALVAASERTTRRSSTSPWRRRGIWLGLAVAVAVGGWLFYAQPWNAGVPAVIVEIVTPGPVTRVLAVNGRIAALRSVAVKSTVAGTLVSPLAEEGDVVSGGTVLARLDDTSQQAAVRQAVAALDQGLVAQTQAGEAVRRAAALGGNVSAVTLEDARNALARADQEVGRLTALLDQAQFQLAKFSIVAPIDGTVLTRGVEPGQVVDLTTTLFTLADLSELVVETNVDESYATHVRSGMPAVLQLTGDERKLDGVVRFVAPVVDANTGGLAVRIGFVEPQAAPVGLTVSANIIVDRRDATISAPRAAVATSGTSHAVFVLEGDKARSVPVGVIDWPAERLIVTDGLTAGDRLITDANGLADGQAVRIAAE